MSVRCKPASGLLGPGEAGGLEEGVTIDLRGWQKAIKPKAGQIELKKVGC